MAKSSTTMNRENTHFTEAHVTTHQYAQTTACSTSDQTESHCSRSSKAESLDPECNNCSENGDSQSCTDTNHSTFGQYYDKDCSECHIVRRDPTPDELTMCLHALSYKVSEMLQVYMCSHFCTCIEVQTCNQSLSRNSNNEILFNFISKTH